MFESPERDYRTHAFLRGLSASAFLHISIPPLLLWANVLGFGISGHGGGTSHQSQQTQRGKTKIEVITRDEFNDGIDINTNVNLALESTSVPGRGKLYLSTDALAKATQGSYPPNPQVSQNRYAQSRQLNPANSSSSTTGISLEEKIRKNKPSEGTTSPDADWKKAIEDMHRDLRYMKDKFESIITFSKYFRSGEGKLEEIYSNRFKPGQRNQKSFDDFFLAFANVYLFQNHDRVITDPIAKNNPHIRESMFLTARFNEDGTFEFTSIQMNPQFRDETGAYESYFRSLLASMPKKFISPSMCECKLPLPYNREYSYIK